MRVRRATVDDFPALAAGMKAVADEDRWLATQPGVSAAELEGRFRGSVDQEVRFNFLLEVDGAAIGMLSLHGTGAPGVLTFGMWVLSEWRGRGGGRKLVEAALRTRPADVHRIELEVFPDNLAAIGLYRSLGFEEEGVRRDHYRRADGSLRSVLIMARLFPSDR